MQNKNNKLPVKIIHTLFGAVEYSGQFIGNILSYINESEIYNQFTQQLGINWLFDKIISVDIKNGII